MTNLFLKHSLITDALFGFKKGKPTKSALLLLRIIIVQNNENVLLTLGIFIDISKALDCLNYKLLDKMSCYDMRGTCFSLLESYLVNRKHSVVVDVQAAHYVSGPPPL